MHVDKEPYLLICLSPFNEFLLWLPRDYRLGELVS